MYNHRSQVTLGVDNIYTFKGKQLWMETRRWRAKYSEGPPATLVFAQLGRGIPKDPPPFLFAHSASSLKPQSSHAIKM